MGALSKFFLSPIYRLISAYFSEFLPQAFRFIIISLFVLYHSYQRHNCRHEYMALINHNSSRFSYRKKKCSEPETASCDSTECSICLSDYEEGDPVRRLRCDHTFHGRCLDKWFHRSQATCPLCRTFVVPEKVAEERRRKEDEHLMVNKGLEEELAMMLLSTRNFWSYHSGTLVSCN